MILTIAVFLVVLSVLVLVHEFGHFVVGKAAGVGVLEFALGLPFTKPLWTKKLKSGMMVSVYPLLFGGFVKLLGEEGPESKSVSGKYFFNVNVWKRIAVVVAGVTMNFLLAVVLFYAFLSASGFKVLVPRLAQYRFASPYKDVVVVTYVQKNSPAGEAGMTAGGVILSADGKSFVSVADFQKYIKSRAGYVVTMRLADQDLANEHNVELTPRLNPPAGQGALGVGVEDVVAMRYETSMEKGLSGLTYSVDMLGYNLRVIGTLAASAFKTHNVAPLSDNVSGPVGIASAIGFIIDLGGREAVVTMLNFVGLLSLSLAFMNILPIPALDGGRLAFLLVEALFGKKLAAKNENLVNQIGMMALLGLIILISFNDVVKWVTSLRK
jgi:regulator of sigma E protease